MQAEERKSSDWAACPVGVLRDTGTEDREAGCGKWDVKTSLCYATEYDLNSETSIERGATPSE